jgi:predicted TIM-barrel fold metal-dependent hydrolase
MSIKVVDFHMHPGPRWCPIERRLHELPVRENFQKIIDAMDAEGADQAICMLLDEDWFRTSAGERLVQELKNLGWDKRLHLVAMFDIFRIYETEDILAQIEFAAKLGIVGIKIHPSLQRVRSEDLIHLPTLAKHANRLGLFVIVHVYGYEVSYSGNLGLDIVSSLVPYLKTPLIIAHGGGIDLPRAVALAKQYPHIMLDFSYILELSENPGINPVPLIKYAIEELGAKRVMYGSDHPSCDAESYRSRFEKIFLDMGLPESDITAIMGHNALNLFKAAKSFKE